MLYYLLTKRFLPTIHVFCLGLPQSVLGSELPLRFSFSKAGNYSLWQGDGTRSTSIALHLIHFWPSQTSCCVDVHQFDLGGDFQGEIETLGDMFYLTNTFHLRILKVLYKYFSTQPNSSAGGKADGEHCTYTDFELQKIICLVSQRSQGGGFGLRRSYPRSLMSYLNIYKAHSFQQHVSFAQSISS